MNVSLTPDLERLVNRRVASGRYGSASEVVREALRLLDDQDRLRQEQLRALRSAIGTGLHDLDEGHSQAFDARALSRIRTRGRARLSRRSKS